MHGGFLSFAKRYFLDVIICVDMFHVVQMLNENINSIRRYLQNAFRDKAAFAKSQGNLTLRRKYTDQYILLKGASRILLTAEANQFESWKQHREKNLLRLEKIFSLSLELKEAYDALLEFHRIIHVSQYAMKRVRFSDFLDIYCCSEYDGILHVANTFRRNRNYIQNTWKYDRSNAVCERLNNRIKIIKRNAYGQHAFHNFRRLYNDAVESMNCYRNVISSLEKESDFYFSRCSELKDIIRELTEE